MKRHEALIRQWTTAVIGTGFIDRAHLEAIPRLDHIQPSARADPELEYAKQLVEAELESIRKQTWLALRARGVNGGLDSCVSGRRVDGARVSDGLAIVGDAFPRMTAKAIGFAITCGWAGLAVSSRLIGAIAKATLSGLKTALLVIRLFPS